MKNNSIIKQLQKLTVLFAVIATLFVAYIFIISPLANGYTGTDDSSVGVIESINTNYRPWISNIWEPETDLGEVLLFALQFTIGAGALVILMRRLKKTPQKSKTII